MRVAVVGAGVSGVVAAAHARRVGLDVTVFERNDAAGGIWFEIRPTYLIFINREKALRPTDSCGTNLSGEQTFASRPEHSTMEGASQKNLAV